MSVVSTNVPTISDLRGIERGCHYVRFVLPPLVGVVDDVAKARHQDREALLIAQALSVLQRLLPGVHRQSELRMVHREEALGAEGVHRLAEVLGEHVDTAPVLLVVLPVLEDSQIQLGELLPDLGIVRAEAAITSDVDRVLRTLQDEGSP